MKLTLCSLLASGLLLAALRGQAAPAAPAAPATRPAASAENAAEKPLTSFSDEDLAKWAPADTRNTQKREGKTPAGGSYVSITWNVYLSIDLTVYKGRGPDGRNAIGIGRMSPLTRIQQAPKLTTFPEDARNAYGIVYGNVFNTTGMFRTMFPQDWSAYDLLRMDVFCEEARHTIRVMLEDEQIAPPLSRDFLVAPGQWTTLEIDLRAAEKARGLDLKRMADLGMAVGKVEGGDKIRTNGRNHLAFATNFRLARNGAPAAFPVVRDDSPMDLPPLYRATAGPRPEQIPPGQPDRSPLKLEAPFKIETATPCSITPVGWAAAYDNNRLMVAYVTDNFQSPGDVQLLQSLDGGKNWAGLDGGPKPTGMYINNANHGSARGDAVGVRGDGIILTNLGCRGRPLPGLRLWARQAVFTGEKGWQVREEPALVDCDLRHCTSNANVIRTKDGRLWAAYGLSGRLEGLCINVRYSDDDGLTWRSMPEGTSGVIPDSIRQDKTGGFGYNHEDPVLVPWGDAVACIRVDRKPANLAFGSLQCARLERKTWTAFETVDCAKRTVYNPLKPRVCAVSVDGKEIYAVSALGPGVMHYAGGKWTAEAPEVPPSARIALAGGKAVVAIAPVPEPAQPGKKAVMFRAWQRSADGRWTGRDLYREEAPLSVFGESGDARNAFMVQPQAPANFVPLAWTCEKQNWIKYLRVPVGE